MGGFNFIEGSAYSHIGHVYPTSQIRGGDKIGISLQATTILLVPGSADFKNISHTGHAYPTSNAGHAYPTSNAGHAYPTSNAGHAYSTSNAGQFNF